MALDDYHRYEPLTEIADEFPVPRWGPDHFEQTLHADPMWWLTSGDLKYTRAAAPWDANGSAR